MIQIEKNPNMSHLLIDIGNSFTKYAVYTAKALSTVSKVKSNLFVEMINSLDIKTPEPLLGIILVSVANDFVTKDIIDKLSKQFQCPVKQVNTVESDLGVKCGYKEFALLGSDRWLAILAAFHHMKKQNIAKPVMVVDCGTVITVDVIDSSGLHLGGWMMPGNYLMYDALVKKSSGIQRGLNHTAKNLLETGQVFGNSTHECVEIGGKLAEQGFIEQCFIQTQNKLQDVPQCILTGGGANDIIPVLTMKLEHLPNLVFEGLALFIE